MYGQMTAGSWIYIGTQGIVQGTYETFAELARQHFGGIARRTRDADRRRGRHGRRAAARRDDERRRVPHRRRGSRPPGAAPRAALSRSRRRFARRGAARGRARAQHAGEALSVGYEGNAAVEFPELYDLGFRPDAVTDQTSAHDLLDGYVPAGLTLDQKRLRCASAIRDEYQRRALESCGAHVQAMVRYLDAGADRVRLRQQHSHAGAARRLRARVRVPRLRAGVHPSIVLPRLRSVSLRRALRRPKRTSLVATPNCSSFSPTTRRWRAGSVSRASGSRSKGCRRASAGSATAIAPKRGSRSTSSCAAGEIKAPIVIGRDHLDTGSVASPYRETEGMK